MLISTGRMIGICYLSTDVTPEINGYNGPIRVLIGLLKTGRVSGIRVLKHRENIIEALVIEKESFDSSFREKPITDPFLPGRDLEHVTGATVTIRQMGSIVKLSARKMLPLCRENPGTNIKISVPEKSMLLKIGGKARRC